MRVGHHPLLRPGVVVCRRGDGALQIGLDPPLAVRAPDVAPVRALLADLRDGAPAPRLADLDPRAARCYLDLLDHHLVVDGDGFVAAIGRVGDLAAQQQLTADVAEHGAVTQRLDRAQVTVGVEATGLADAGDALARLLQRAGFAIARQALAAATDADAPRADLVVLLDTGVTDRSVTDRLVVDDIPHLPISCAEGRVRVGPFVVPGQSGCVRCVDAARAQRDPRRPLLVEQYARHRSAWPAAVPHDLLHVAVGCAVREVSLWASGARPTTWSAVLEVDPALTLPREPCPPHPECGCSWDLLYAGSPEA